MRGMETSPRVVFPKGRVGEHGHLFLTPDAFNSANCLRVRPRFRVVEWLELHMHYASSLIC